MRAVLLCCCVVMSCGIAPCAAQSYATWAIGGTAGFFGSAPAGDNAALSASWFNTQPEIGGWTPDFKRDIESRSTMLVAGGIYVQYYFTKFFALQTGVMYRPEALYYEQDISFNAPGYYPWLRKFRMEGRYTYIEIPLYGRAVLDVPGDLFPYVFAGPSVSLLINQSLEGRVGGFNPGETGTAYHIRTEAQSSVAGACIGAGAYVKTREKVKLGFDIRYRWSLQSAVTAVKIEDELSRDIDLRFSSWGISAAMEVAL